MLLALKSKSSILTILGERIKGERLAQNLTQMELAGRSGVAYSTLRRIESCGEGSMSDYVSLLFAFGKLDQIDRFLVPTMINPEVVYKMRGRVRQRATGRKAA